MDTGDESIASRVGRRRRTRPEAREELEEDYLNEDEGTSTMSDTAAAAEAARLAEIARMQMDRDNAVITDPDFMTAIETVMNLKIESQIPQALFDSGF